jgi:xanthine/uracil/vitamin C permease (AzgA family)
MMMGESRKIDWNEMHEALPAFFTTVMMPFSYRYAALPSCTFHSHYVGVSPCVRLYKVANLGDSFPAIKGTVQATALC